MVRRSQKNSQPQKRPTSSLFLCNISIFGVSLMNVTGGLPEGCTSPRLRCTLLGAGFLWEFAQAKPLWKKSPLQCCLLLILQGAGCLPVEAVLIWGESKGWSKHGWAMIHRQARLFLAGLNYSRAARHCSRGWIALGCGLSPGRKGSCPVPPPIKRVPGCLREQPERRKNPFFLGSRWEGINKQGGE